MIIKTLVENTSISDQFTAEHGLSLYIQTKSHNLLFDLGMSGLFLENSKKLDVNISEIDLVIISHGHYDHGGGLQAFLQANSKAKIYLNKKAFEKHYSLRGNGVKAYIGLQEELKDNERFVFVDDYLKIDEELELFSNVKEKECFSLSNKVLLMGNEDDFLEDTFDHEQNLIITENEKTLLVAGCAHNGIVNIVNLANRLKQVKIDYVIGGFHLFNHNSKKCESYDLINEIGKRLNQTSATYYTCHCTGIEPYDKLKKVMHEKIQYLATGSQLII